MNKSASVRFENRASNLFFRIIYIARSFPYLQDSLRGPRQTVDLPPQDEIENDECENADCGDWRERIDQKDSCRYDPKHPEHIVTIVGCGYKFAGEVL